MAVLKSLLAASLQQGATIATLVIKQVERCPLMNIQLPCAAVAWGVSPNLMGWAIAICVGLYKILSQLILHT
jgi:hypothetical protein